MTAKGRVQLKADNQALFPTQNNKEITALRLRTFNDDDVDSFLNLIDDSAFQLAYPPTTPTDWSILPTDSGNAFDIIAKQIKSSFSQNVAFFGPTGSDAIGEFELGNMAKPFLTFQAAVDAVPLNYGKVISLGGEFTEAVVTIQKNNFSLDFTNSKLNGELWIKDCNNTECNFDGSVIENNSGVALRVTGGASDKYKRIKGGEFKSSQNGGTCVVAGRATLSKLQITTTGTCAGIQATNTRLVNVDMLTTDGRCVFRSTNSEFHDCDMISTGSNIYNTQGKYNSFYSCRMLANLVAVGGETFLSGRFWDCDIRSLTTFAINFNGTDENVEFANCTISGATDTVNFTAAPKPAGQVYLFQNCRLYCGGGFKIFNDTLAVFGTAQVALYMNIFNETLNLTNPASFDQFTNKVNTGLILPPIS